MKTYSIIFLIAAVLALGSCSTAYRSGQTPDAVYYSPEQERTVYTSNNNGQTVIQGDNPDAGSYVVYNNGEDGYNNYYEDGYYSRRINMFDRPGSLYSFNNYYLSNPWHGVYDPFMWNGMYAMNMGLYNPYFWSYPSLSLSLGWGSPFSRWYSPFWRHYSPWYSYGYYSPYYTGYYGNYWGGGFGKNINIAPRPAVSYGPRRSVSSRAASGVSSPRVSGEHTNSPRRVFRSNNNTGNDNPGTVERPRRVFKSKTDEHPIQVNNNTRTPNRRVFRSPNNNQQNNYRPSENRSFNRPSRTFNSSPVNTSSSGSSRSFSSPARVSAPRGR